MVRKTRTPSKTTVVSNVKTMSRTTADQYATWQLYPPRRPIGRKRLRRGGLISLLQARQGLVRTAGTLSQAARMAPRQALAFCDGYRTIRTVCHRREHPSRNLEYDRQELLRQSKSRLRELRSSARGTWAVALGMPPLGKAMHRRAFSCHHSADPRRR